MQAQLMLTADRVSTRLARVGLPGRMVLIACVSVMVPISCCWMIVIVRGRPVVVIRVIVPDVLVDVQRRRHGRRHDQGLNKHECDEPAHGSSLLRPAGTLRNTRRISRWGEWTGYGSVTPLYGVKSCQTCWMTVGSITFSSPFSGSFSEYSTSLTLPHCGPSAPGLKT